ncbi:hypothetical protein FHT72_002374 [Rhizobium sp. BK077]|uniref:hypothetical protein n=1 Tax=unclassified Rhizobium TaxID=2613769 RepID=UPI001608046E|nr:MULTISPECIES: hypothetical protein [unclassified Rhizobium]MBB3299380.1 hypothetical protein [Rhizobium sp. BK112]MBB3367898.1 hypothetical protein [Rhizobium sp. BK077]
MLISKRKEARADIRHTLAPPWNYELTYVKEGAFCVTTVLIDRLAGASYGPIKLCLPACF